LQFQGLKYKHLFGNFQTSGGQAHPTPLLPDADMRKLGIRPAMKLMLFQVVGECLLAFCILFCIYVHLTFQIGAAADRTRIGTILPDKSRR
jgi:hypothetical protein